MIDWAALTLFLFISARMSGFILFNPILGRNNVPGNIRLGMAIILTVYLFSFTEPQPLEMPNSILVMALRMIVELFLGFLLGMVFNFFFYIPQLAGSMVDTQMGMTMNQIYDAGSQANLSASGVLLNGLMTLLFFAGGGHLTLMRIFLTSEQIVPYGQATLAVPALNLLLELFAECTVLAVKLCMPILAAELIAQVGMGILMKVIPQINVFAINIELKVIVGLALLLVLMSPFSEFLLEAEALMLNSLHEVLTLTAR
ncbi:MAG: flagellar biosynthetic protein FliR [Ruminiclostridium sp.]|nr:flagellar biosynthetic protein FliR [Ruminiclostridium sp.]MCI9467094.1 flagellar biosynthetic protein FliR [Ruminiclostridium sp.]